MEIEIRILNKDNELVHLGRAYSFESALIEVSRAEQFVRKEHPELLVTEEPPF